MIQLTLTLKMTIALVVRTSVTVNNNNPIQDYVHPDDHTQPTCDMTPWFKPFTDMSLLVRLTVTTGSVTTLHFRSLSEKGPLATQLYHVKKYIVILQYTCQLFQSQMCEVLVLSLPEFPNISGDFLKTFKCC